MGDGDNAKGGAFSDRISLLISIVALLASRLTLYYQFWQGPLVHAYPSRVVYLSKSNQIGISVSFTNSGAGRGHHHRRLHRPRSRCPRPQPDLWPAMSLAVRAEAHLRRWQMDRGGAGVFAVHGPAAQEPGHRRGGLLVQPAVRQLQPLNRGATRHAYISFLRKGDRCLPGRGPGNRSHGRIAVPLSPSTLTAAGSICCAAAARIAWGWTRRTDPRGQAGG